VIGVGGVLIADLSSAYVDPNSQYFSILNVNTHYITHGDRINLNTRQVTYDLTWKTNLRGQEAYDSPLTSANVFGGVLATQDHSEYVRASTSVFDARLEISTTGVTVESNPQFRVLFYHNTAASGYGGYSPVTTKFEISYSGLLVDIEAL